MRVRFLSKNTNKFAEVSAILGPIGIEVIPVAIPIQELQADNAEVLVRDKVLRAFGQLGHRIFVEHTGLFLDALNGFPGGLTQPFWDALQPERFCELFGRGERRSLTAKTWIGYCDGRRIYQFRGEIEGSIAPEPRGDRTFQWDCVFIPNGHKETFAEMGERKNTISMRRKALDSFAIHLKDEMNA